MENMGNRRRGPLYHAYPVDAHYEIPLPVRAIDNSNSANSGGVALAALPETVGLLRDFPRWSWNPH
jgi:hypothetical protein